jgi:hypothetical protein
MSLRRDTYWSSTVCFALMMYWSQTSDIRLCSRMQKMSVLFSEGGRTTIPSGRSHQNLSLDTTSFGWPSWIFLSSAGEGTLHLPISCNVPYSILTSRASSPWISHQHWWWASVWTADKASQVFWIWPKVCSGRSFSVLNRSSAIQRVLQRSHLSDSFFFVIRWIQTLEWERMRVHS